MRAAVLLFLILVPLIILTILGVVAAIRPGSSIAAQPGPRLSEVRRRTSQWRWIGVLAGTMLAGGAIASGASLGRGTMLAAPLFVLGVLAGVTVGELQVTAPAKSSRRAALEVRRARDYLPRILTTIVALSATVLGGVLIATTALGSPDELGNAGRQLVWACSESITGARGPWPGTFYSLPLATVVTVGLLGAGLALKRVVRRPRQGEQTDIDDALRRHAASAIVAASGILVVVPLAGVATFASIALLGVSCPPLWMTAFGWTLAATVPLAAALAAWCVVVLGRPTAINVHHEAH